MAERRQAAQEDRRIRLGQPELRRAEHAAVEQREQRRADRRQVVAQQQVVVGQDRDLRVARNALREREHGRVRARCGAARGDAVLQRDRPAEPAREFAGLALRVMQAEVGIAFKPGTEQRLRNRFDAGAAALGQQLQPRRVVVMHQHAVEVEQDDGRRIAHAFATRNASRAATRVCSITASSCAADMKPASNADGARYTPRSSMAWKKRLNAALSQAIACA